jgi:branched-chain amino acid transport system ATP-binding protein
MAMLELTNVETFYGTIQALFGMSLRCERGEVTTLLGRNGMGKTTTVGSIIGTLSSRSGEIRFDGEVVNGRPAYEVEAGIPEPERAGEPGRHGREL